MTEISKAYEPQSVEDKWYQFWLGEKFFVADAKSPKPAYSIVIPPPNVTGVLTLGHVLNNTIQDILARKARMDGKEVLWLPGTDHAGIATQTVVERALKKEGKIKHRDDLGREKFLEEVWKWKNEKGGIIIQQLKKLGASCDWTRERFTMDAEYSRCVQRVFVDLYKKGLIYRGRRMVNWCPASLTALSDEEVIMKEQKGFLYYFKVEVAEIVGQASRLSQIEKEKYENGDRRDACPTFLTIATTRPETIPGDTAVAVNPKDPRYAHLIGKQVVRPLPVELPHEQKLIPIIGDDHVDFEFGTGVLKVTPAHDKADFEIGLRHKLRAIEVIAANGQMNAAAGADLRGLDRFKARKVAVEKLTELGALEKEEPYTNNVGYSERADVPIEPRLSEQWFLKYPSVEKARNCVAQDGFSSATNLSEKKVRIVHATGNEISGKSIRELRKAALFFAREHHFLGVPFKNEDSGIQIRVGRQSLSHAFSNLGVANIRAVAVLPELIRTAIWISSEPHEPHNPMVKKVHRFVAALSLAGELHRVLITAKEFFDGTILYDHKAKKITFGGKSLEAHLPKEKLDTQPAPNAEVKVGDLLADVNVGKMQFHPQRWAKVYDHWMRGIQDWCISRQLWWGHRIPVWYSEGKMKLHRTMVIVKLRGNELAGSNVKELRKSAFAFAKKQGIIGQDFLNLDTDQSITIHKASLEHAFSNFGVANVKLIPALPDLLRHAVRVSVEPHKPASDDVKAVETYLAALQLGDQFFRVKFRVKVFAPNFRLYDHQTVLLWKTKENEPDGNKSPEAQFPKEPTSRPASGSPMTLADLISDVNTNPAFTRCQIESPGENWVQDPDVLDTWFSSWLWPFATMGWPTPTDTLKKFYPTTDLVTGPDIIFFWVARMIMAGYEFMGEMPFQNVYFTGIIRDKQGRKMSKSLGNSPDPLDLIAKFGADALRFGVMRAAPLGQDILFDEQNVELGRNFCNKLWNACRFRQMVGQASRLSPIDSENISKNETGATPVLQHEVQGEIEPTLLSSDDKWILLKLDAAIREVTIALNEYKFSEATAALYRFFWNEYCDWYVEASKAVLGSARVPRADSGVAPESSSDKNQLKERASGATPKAATGTVALPENFEARKANTLAVIDFVLSHTLRLFHPFLPFITEELWHGMGYATDMPGNQGGKTIMNAPWPMPLDEDFKGHYGLDDCYLEMTDAKYELITQGRDLRRAGNIQAAKKVKYVFKPAQHLTPHDAEVIKLLLNAESLEVNADYQPPKGTPVVASQIGELFLPLEGLIDVAAEKIRLAKEVEKIQSEIMKVEHKLANPNFTQKVPPTVLAEHEQRLADWNAKLAHTQALLAALG